jgi:Mg2+ and Co2+ transporter CorA
MRKKKTKEPEVIPEISEDLREIFRDIDAAVDNSDTYEELDANLIQVWFKHGLITGNMICGIGGSPGG